MEQKQQSLQPRQVGVCWGAWGRGEMRWFPSVITDDSPLFAVEYVLRSSADNKDRAGLEERKASHFREEKQAF